MPFSFCGIPIKLEKGLKCLVSSRSLSGPTPQDPDSNVGVFYFIPVEQRDWKALCRPDLYRDPHHKTPTAMLGSFIL
jgi:hypothetical protein